jgi:hypothetical protein
MRITLANARVDIHIDADGLIRDNRERWRFRADAIGCAPLYIEKIIAWQQLNAMFSPPVTATRAISFVRAQDDQWILSIGFGRNRRSRHFIGGFNRLERNNLQMSLDEALGRSFNRCSAGQDRKSTGSKFSCSFHSMQ